MQHMTYFVPRCETIRLKPSQFLVSDTALIPHTGKATILKSTVLYVDNFLELTQIQANKTHNVESNTPIITIFKKKL